MKGWRYVYSETQPSYTGLSRRRSMDGGLDLGNNTTQRGPRGGGRGGKVGGGQVIHGDLEEQALWLKKLPKHVIRKCFCSQRLQGAFREYKPS